MTDVLVSVVMPAYNAERYIEESIQSVIIQTYSHWELIIVDDGSIDCTASIVKRYTEKDARIKYIYQANGGPGKARNTAIQKSEGIYIAFLDSDDLWLKEKLEVSLREIIAGDYSLIFTDSFVFHDDSRNISTAEVMEVREGVFQGRDSLPLFLTGNAIPNLTVLVKKVALLQVGGFGDSRLAEDYELWLKLLYHDFVFKAIPIPLSAYRVHASSISANDRLSSFEVIKILKNFGIHHPEFYDETRKIIRTKIKYWLYNGNHRTNEKFRDIMKNVYQIPISTLIYCLSFVFPLSFLRKLIVRIS